MRRTLIIPALISFCLLFIYDATFADIYKYEDDEGIIYLTNSPTDCTKEKCTEEQKTRKYVKIREEKRIFPGNRKSSNGNNKSVSGNYKYTEDIEKENKDKEWSELKQRIGEVYEFRPNEVDQVKFYERNNAQSREFIVTEKEKFTIVDGFIKPILDSDNLLWLSSSETWPKSSNKNDSFALLKTVIYEIIFESGKLAYLAVSYQRWDGGKINYRLDKLGHSTIKFVKKQKKEQISKVIQKSRQIKGIKDDD